MSKSALVKYKKKHLEVKKVYLCQDCDAKCGLAHTLREHYRDIHGFEITTAYANTLGVEEAAQPKVLKYPKRIFEVVQCLCGVNCKGEYVFKRHVRNKHGQEYDKWRRLQVKVQEKSNENIYI